MTIEKTGLDIENIKVSENYDTKKVIEIYDLKISCLETRLRTVEAELNRVLKEKQ